MKEINLIHWHDCELESVIEIPSKDMLVFNVQYPESYEQNIFVSKSIVFVGYYSQEVNEMPFEGNPTILGADVLSEIGSPFQKDGYYKIHIETNAGDRFVVAKSIKVLNEHVSI
ncbi:MAG: hypothetical protein GY829_11485 [Gammaproteobacteria bacterium]|nr:hypothetical protein [Gammaproteobacteria bacterium]